MGILKKRRERQEEEAKRQEEEVRLRTESKKILEKQLQLLSKYSEKCVDYKDLDGVTQAMIRITEFLCPFL